MNNIANNWTEKTHPSEKYNNPHSIIGFIKGIGNKKWVITAVEVKRCKTILYLFYLIYI